PGQIGAVLVHRALGLAMTSGEAGGGREPRRPIRVETIASETCAYLRVDMTEMLGRGRHKRVVLARSLTAHLARRMTSLSYPEIARAMSRPNHSTVITAHHRVEGQIKEGGRIACGSEFDGMTMVEVRDGLARRIERVAAGQ
ncbi:MAG: helix-turn-helix domain-containing protein, partial [Planctomycetota bacterium]